MAPRREPTTSKMWLGGREFVLGTYIRADMGALAKDIARLLHHQFLLRSGVSTAGPVPQPTLQVLEGTAVAELQARPEWGELTACASLADAVEQLASSDLAVQVGTEGGVRVAGAAGRCLVMRNV